MHLSARFAPLFEALRGIVWVESTMFVGGSGSGVIGEWLYTGPSRSPEVHGCLLHCLRGASSVTGTSRC